MYADLKEFLADAKSRILCIMEAHPKIITSYAHAYDKLFISSWHYQFDPGMMLKDEYVFCRRLSRLFHMATMSDESRELEEQTHKKDFGVFRLPEKGKQCRVQAGVFYISEKTRRIMPAAMAVPFNVNYRTRRSGFRRIFIKGSPVLGTSQYVHILLHEMAHLMEENRVEWSNANHDCNFDVYHHALRKFFYYLVIWYSVYTKRACVPDALSELSYEDLAEMILSSSINGTFVKCINNVAVSKWHLVVEFACKKWNRCQPRESTWSRHLAIETMSEG